jgi:hypothetical protein
MRRCEKALNFGVSGSTKGRLQAVIVQSVFAGAAFGLKEL